MLIRVETARFVAGVIANEGGVIEVTAPILAWARGKKTDILVAWVMKQPGGKITVINR